MNRVLVRAAHFTVTHAGQHTMAMGAVTADSADRKTLVAAVNTPMGAGVYSITLQAAGADGNPIRGAYTFTVDAPTAK